MTGSKVPTVIDRYPEVTAHIENIIAASDANRDSLGFYPRSVFEDFARRGGLFVLLISRESGQCFAGHLLSLGGRFQVGANVGQTITVASINSVKSSALGTVYSGEGVLSATVKEPNGTVGTSASGNAPHLHQRSREREGVGIGSTLHEPQRRPHPQRRGRAALRPGQRAGRQLIRNSARRRDMGAAQYRGRRERAGSVPGSGRSASYSRSP